MSTPPVEIATTVPKQRRHYFLDSYTVRRRFGH